MSNDKFNQVIDDFVKDLIVTFPELKDILSDINKEEYLTHCSETYPKIFFELLYENEKLFEAPCFLLPDIDFTILMKDPALTDKTKKTIWKYLQLILFSILDTLNDKDQFGDTSKLFEAINESDLHKKIAETMDSMKDFFVNDDATPDSSGTESSGLPPFMDADKLKDHLDGLMGGKIGSLAKEIAEEAAKTIGNQEEFMQSVMKNPQKILSLVKDIGSKLEDKIKKGDVKESELLEEATELIEKMKDIPGIKEMMSKMGMNGKMDFKGMANKMQQNMKNVKTKERLQKKVEERRAHISKTNEDTFNVKVDDSTPLRSKRPKRKKHKKPKVDEPIIE
jgi:hypothetical protein